MPAGVGRARRALRRVPGAQSRARPRAEGTAGGALLLVSCARGAGPAHVPGLRGSGVREVAPSASRAHRGGPVLPVRRAAGVPVPGGLVGADGRRSGAAVLPAGDRSGLRGGLGVRPGCGGRRRPPPAGPRGPWSPAPRTSARTGATARRRPGASPAPGRRPRPRRRGPVRRARGGRDRRGPPSRALHRAGRPARSPALAMRHRWPCAAPPVRRGPPRHATALPARPSLPQLAPPSPRPFVPRLAPPRNPPVPSRVIRPIASTAAR